MRWALAFRRSTKIKHRVFGYRGVHSGRWMYGVERTDVERIVLLGRDR